MKSYLQKSPIPFKYVVLAMLALALLLAAQTGSMFIRGEGLEVDITGHTILLFCKYLLWALYIPLISSVIQTYRGSQDTKARIIGTGLLYTILITLSHAIISNAIYILIIWLVIDIGAAQTNLDEFILYIIPITLSRVIDFVAIVGVLISVTFYNTYNEKKLQIAELETQLKAIELSAIRNQISPHFLFNSLNTISALMDQDINQAQRVLGKVSRLLRALLEKSKKHSIPFAEEIEIVKNYLEIEKERFYDRLEISYDIRDGIDDYEVPYLIIQPLVENCIKHSVSKSSELVKLEIECKIENERLYIRVWDNGEGVSNTENLISKGGVGLSSISGRLKGVYGDNSSLIINSEASRFFEIILRFPANKIKP
ncbi:MAG: histidine kinase [Balneolaceae bacterium]